MPINIGDHTAMARDDLRDGVIQNIEQYLGSMPLAGSAGSAKTYRTVAASAAINNVETLLLAAPLTLAGTAFGQATAGTINPGTIITITIQGTNTNTVANTTTFGIRMGILGTVSDAAVATFVTPVSGSTGTAIPFTAVITINVLTVSATGTATGQMIVNSVTAGIIGAPISFNVGSAAAITAMPDTTATFFDVTLVSAATTTTSTIQSTTINIQP
jgi:hypothetical protein